MPSHGHSSHSHASHAMHHSTIGSHPFHNSAISHTRHAGGAGRVVLLSPAEVAYNKQISEIDATIQPPSKISFLFRFAGFLQFVTIPLTIACIAGPWFVVNALSLNRWNGEPYTSSYYYYGSFSNNNNPSPQRQAGFLTLSNFQDCMRYSYDSSMGVDEVDWTFCSLREESIQENTNDERIIIGSNVALAMMIITLISSFTGLLRHTMTCGPRILRKNDPWYLQWTKWTEKHLMLNIILVLTAVFVYSENIPVAISDNVGDVEADNHLGPCFDVAIAALVINGLAFVLFRRYAVLIQAHANTLGAMPEVPPPPAPTTREEAAAAWANEMGQQMAAGMMQAQQQQQAMMMMQQLQGQQPGQQQQFGPGMMMTNTPYEANKGVATTTPMGMTMGQQQMQQPMMMMMPPNTTTGMMIPTPPGGVGGNGPYGPYGISPNGSMPFAPNMSPSGVGAGGMMMYPPPFQQPPQPGMMMMGTDGMNNMGMGMQNTNTNNNPNAYPGGGGLRLAYPMTVPVPNSNITMPMQMPMQQPMQYQANNNNNATLGIGANASNMGVVVGGAILPGMTMMMTPPPSAMPYTNIAIAAPGNNNTNNMDEISNNDNNYTNDDIPSAPSHISGGGGGGGGGGSRNDDEIPMTPYGEDVPPSTD